jgi:hypothetical protein
MEFLKNQNIDFTSLKYDSVWDLEAKKLFPDSLELQEEFNKQKKRRKKKNL